MCQIFNMVFLCVCVEIWCIPCESFGQSHSELIGKRTFSLDPWVITAIWGLRGQRKEMYTLEVITVGSGKYVKTHIETLYLGRITANIVLHILGGQNVKEELAGKFMHKQQGCCSKVPYFFSCLPCCFWTWILCYVINCLPALRRGRFNKATQILKAPHYFLEKSMRFHRRGRE